MNFLACEGDWLVDASGSLGCTGTLITLTTEELQDLTSSALTWEDVSELRGEVMVLFAVVFGFLVLKSVLKAR